MVSVVGGGMGGSIQDPRRIDSKEKQNGNEGKTNNRQRRTCRMTKEKQSGESGDIAQW